MIAHRIAGAVPADCSPQWTQALARAANGQPRQTLHADGTLVTTPAAKAALHARTGAHAVDTESHIAARVAARHGLPLAAIRIVSDTAAQALHPAFAHAMRPDGATDLAAMLAYLARHPDQVPTFITAARDGARALAALRRLANHLGPGLGYPCG